MAKTKCPQCGAKNAPDARRCRVCANLLNAAIPEQEHRPKGLPDHIQRRVDAQLEQQASEPTFIPGVTPAAGTGGYGPSPEPPGGPAFGAGPEPGGFGAPDAGAGPIGAPPPPAWAAPPPPPAWAAPPPGPVAAPAAFDNQGADPGFLPPPPGDEIIIEAGPRHPGEPAPPPPEPAAEFEKFDADALFRDMGRAPLPPPPPPPDELRMPPPPTGPDPLWQIEVPDGATSAEIEAAAAKAMRDERLNRRPSFLDKVFKADDADDEPGGEPRPF